MNTHDAYYAEDITEILSHRHDNGADYWATPDKKLLKGAPLKLSFCKKGMPSLPATLRFKEILHNIKQ